jgi:hypothetical protein
MPLAAPPTGVQRLEPVATALRTHGKRYQGDFRLADNAEALATIGDALNDDGDILLQLQDRRCNATKPTWHGPRTFG